MVRAHVRRRRDALDPIGLSGPQDLQAAVEIGGTVVDAGQEM
jgi:hypothetical protein